MPTTGMPSIEAGITADPYGQLYPVIVTVLRPDTSYDTLYVKSPDCRAKAAPGKTKANTNMTEKNTVDDDIDFLFFIVSPY